MAYVIPTFNLTCNIWRFPNLTPPNQVGAPDVVSICNLQFGRHVQMDNTSNGAQMYLLLPKLTDIRGLGAVGAFSDGVEVPAGSGRMYRVVWADDIGKGFANEHRCAWIGQDANFNWPTPMP